MEAMYPETEKKAIHPLGIFKEGFGLWQRNFPALSCIYLIFYLPLFIFQILFPRPNILFDMLENNRGSLNEDLSIAIGLRFWIIFLPSLILSAWAFVAMAITANKFLNNLPCKIWESITDTKSHFFSYVSTRFDYWVLVIGICVLIVRIADLFLRELNKNLLGVIASIGMITSVYFATRLWLAGIISIIEDKHNMKALNRSYDLGKRQGYTNIMLGVFLVISAVSSWNIWAMISVGWPVGLSVWTILFLAGIILIPLSISLRVILYQKLIAG